MTHDFRILKESDEDLNLLLPGPTKSSKFDGSEGSVPTSLAGTHMLGDVCRATFVERRLSRTVSKSTPSHRVSPLLGPRTPRNYRVCVSMCDGPEVIFSKFLLGFRRFLLEQKHRHGGKRFLCSVFCFCLMHCQFSISITKPTV